MTPLDAIAAVAGAPVISAEPLTGGLTAAACYRVQLAGGGTAFAKVAVDDATAADLANEIDFYEAVAAPYLAAVRGHGRPGGMPVLLLEDLGPAGWPPPWPADLEPLWEALAALGDTAPPAHLEPVAPRPGRWEAVAAAPERLIAAGFFTAGWLDRCLPTLVEGEESAPLAGEALVHADLWYSNVCFTTRGVRFVDWASSVRGHPQIDAATLALEMRIAGRPHPGFPHEAGFAALLAGGFARQLLEGAPPGVDADRLDTELREALGPAVAWAAELLGLPVPG